MGRSFLFLTLIVVLLFSTHATPTYPGTTYQLAQRREKRRNGAVLWITAISGVIILALFVIYVLKLFPYSQTYRDNETF